MESDGLGGQKADAFPFKGEAGWGRLGIMITTRVSGNNDYYFPFCSDVELCLWSLWPIQSP